MLEEFEIIPAKFRVARAIRNLSAPQLAELANVDRRTILSIENNKRKRIDFEIFEKLVKALDFPQEFFKTENFKDFKL